MAVTIDGSANTIAAAALSLSTATGSAPSYSARAWVNFNGTGTVAIRASGNVSSITDNNTGDYTVNFTNAMPDANYIGVHSGAPHNGRFYSNWNGTYNNATTAIINTTTTYRIVFADGGGVVSDSTNVYASFFR